MMAGWPLSAKKTRAILKKGPATLRNIIYSRFSYWPTSRIDGCDLQHVPTYCISLATAHRKRALIQKQARGLGLTRFEFVDAVNARSLSYAALAEQRLYDDDKSKQYHANGLTLNEIACSLSHRSIYTRVMSQQEPLAVVVEDDALFVARRLRQFHLADVPPDFDIAFLNTFLTQEPPLGHVKNNVFDATSYHGSSAAYLISLAGATKLSTVSCPIIHAADGLLGRCLRLLPGETHPFKQVGVDTTLNSYIVFPDCVLNGSTSHYHVSDVQPH
jgi:glycosyl transferase family 25